MKYIMTTTFFNREKGAWIVSREKSRKINQAEFEKLMCRESWRAYGFTELEEVNDFKRITCINAAETKKVLVKIKDLENDL